MLIFYPLCYAVVLIFLTYYAQEQELCSAHNNYIQVCINKSLHITEFIKTVILESIYSVPKITIF